MLIILMSLMMRTCHGAEGVHGESDCDFDHGEGESGAGEEGCAACTPYPGVAICPPSVVEVPGAVGVGCDAWV